MKTILFLCLFFSLSATAQITVGGYTLTDGGITRRMTGNDGNKVEIRDENNRILAYKKDSSWVIIDQEKAIEVMFNTYVRRDSLDRDSYINLAVAYSFLNKMHESTLRQHESLVRRVNGFINAIAPPKRPKK